MLEYLVYTPMWVGVNYSDDLYLYSSKHLFCRFGFVTFDDVAAAKKALSEFDGHEVDGFNIGLRFAEDRPREGGSGGRGGGRGGGGFGGRGGGFGGRGGGFGGRGGGFGGRGGGRGKQRLGVCTGLSAVL